MKSKWLPLFLTCSLLIYFNGFSQSESTFWKSFSNLKKNEVGTRISVKNAVYVEFDYSLFLEKTAVLMKGSSNVSSILMSLPTPTGELVEFKITRNSTMHPDLANRYTSIRSFDAKATNVAGLYGKIDITPQGFHGMIFQPNGLTYFIDPVVFGGSDLKNYMVYLRADFETSKVFDCKHKGESLTEQGIENIFEAKAFGDCNIRKYRIAVAATGEYSVFQGGTLELALAAQVTTINRVNAVYERDLGVTLELIANNDAIIYVDPTTDPYTNGNTSQMYSQNQTNVTAVIGSANYDIGHVFGTDSGGLAGLGVVCKNNSKANGVTGSSAPVNDPFDIDYVAHEVGHQFGANHTFNNSCSGNRNSSTAMEPGSGSTIMAYAGICPPNVKANSDDHFHGVSLKEISTFILGTNHTCPTIIPSSNNAPVISNLTTGIYVPIGTPFALTATATDADDDLLTYCWEQMDREISTQAPLATATSGPNFRSFSPDTSATRFFPSIANQLSNAFSWERLPTVARSMKFRVSVRDNALGGGCIEYKDLTVNVTAEAGPFVVLYPSVSGIVWEGNSTQTVTWDVANTTENPINAAKVDILLSTDLGETFILLKSQTDNDGSEEIVVPNVATTKAIVMVRSASGVFFDVSDKRFRINKSSLGVSEDVLSTLQVYPNPSSGKITVAIPKGIVITSVQIVDKVGRIIGSNVEQTDSAISCDLSTEATGVYLLQLQTVNGNHVIKVVKD